jgi:hypothetical protein
MGKYSPLSECLSMDNSHAIRVFKLIAQIFYALFAVKIFINTEKNVINKGYREKTTNKIDGTYENTATPQNDVERPYYNRLSGINNGSVNIIGDGIGKTGFIYLYK